MSAFSVGGAGRDFVESSRCTATNGASRPGSVTRSRHGTARDAHGTYPTVTSLPSVSSVGALAMIFGSASWASASAKSFGTLMSTHRNQRVLRVLLRVSASLLVLMVLATTAAPVPAATATTVSWADMTSSARGGYGRCAKHVSAGKYRPCHDLFESSAYSTARVVAKSPTGNVAADQKDPNLESQTGRASTAHIFVNPSRPAAVWN